MRNEVVTLALATMILLSVLFHYLPLVSAAYTVENPYMPYPGEPVCAMKTKTDGYFYVPNIATDLLKVEMLFDDQNITGDQTGETSPYSSVENYPDGKVNIRDVAFVASKFGLLEGESGWDYMADVCPDRKINIRDIAAVAANSGKNGTYITDLSGVTVTFNTGEERTPDNNGFVTIPQGVANFTVERYSTSIGAMITFWQIGDPIAYSTTFEFTVPVYVQEDVEKTVHYYILASVYVPSELSGEDFYFVASANASVQNVKLNSVAKAGSGSPVNIDLGTLSGGYHLLEFELVEVGGIGWVKFHVATSGGEFAWLVRFRIYVPNFSNTEYRYTVKTHSNFPISDTFFLQGYADGFIDDLKLGGGLLWLDWQWESAYDAIYGWDDGFLYRLGYLDPAAWRDVEFTFGKINASGLLDFQIISWTYQMGLIGAPIFLAKCEYETSEGCGWWTITDKKAYAGSEWYSEPGTSNRKFAVTHEISAYGHGFLTGDHYLTLLFSLGVGWVPMSTASNPDFGITLNLTILDYSGSTGCRVNFKSFTTMIEIYAPEQVFHIGDIEFSGVPGSRSIVTSSFKTATATTIAIGVGLASIYGTSMGALLTAVGGTAAKEIFDYYFDQALDPYAIDYKNDTYCKLKPSTPAWFLAVSTPNYDYHPTTTTDVIFLSLSPRATKHCGMMKIVFSGIIDTNIVSVHMGPQIGKLTTTIYIPMFY